MEQKKKEENKIQNQIISRPQHYEIFPYITSHGKIRISEQKLKR